jgi:RHS repeat-associated protein
VETASADSTDYLYNALGQMYEKSGTLGTTLFMQDEAGHLIGEYSGSGSLIEETVWLGDIPVATLQPNGSGGVNIYYVHTDHLNSPRKVAQPSTGTLAWRWDSDPFGTAAPDQNPAGLGTFLYDLRFPGQYYQAETGLNQNWDRDYDPLVGRFAEPDPMGRLSGIDPYRYVHNNPVSLVDPSGLFSVAPAVIEQALARAGLAEAAGLGPEDPLADLAAVALALETIVAANDENETQSNVIPFPPKPKSTDTSESCPTDDGCERDQRVLLGQRLVLMNMLGARTVSIQDYALKANAFNQRAAAHNARCPANKVASVPLGPRGV